MAEAQAPAAAADTGPRGIRNNTAGIREIGDVRIHPGKAAVVPFAFLKGNDVATEWRERGEIDVLASLDDVEKVNAGQSVKIAAFAKKAEAKAEEQKNDEKK